jgi:uncharacterized delta-60 repeat protein
MSKPIVYGDTITGTCQQVGNLVPRQLQLDGGGKLAKATGSGFTGAGKLLLASRKSQYKAAFLAMGLTICEDFHPFDKANAPLRLALEKVAGSAEAYLWGDAGLDPCYASHFLADTSFDMPFGTPSVTFGDSFVEQAVVQSDGKLLGAGVGDPTSTTSFVARFTTAGAVDTTFGSAGIATVFLGQSAGDPDYDSELDQFAINPDGSGAITCVAQSSTLEGMTFTTLDNTGATIASVFAADPDLNGNAYTPPSAFCVLADGRFVAMKQHGAKLNIFTAAGTNTQQVSITGLGSISTATACLAGQTDGKWVLGTTLADGSAIVLARWNADGTLDFSTTLVIADGLGLASGSIALSPTGAMVIALVNPHTLKLFLARFNSDGTPDTNFGAGAGYVSGTAVDPNSLRTIVVAAQAP